MKPLKFLDSAVLANAFLHSEKRKVDKAGCISFQGEKYEAGLNFIGCTVEVIYDPADISKLTIEYEGHPPWTAKRLIIGEKTGPRPKLPPHLMPQQAQGSRLLTAADRQNKARKAMQTPAVSYIAVNRDGENSD